MDLCGRKAAHAIPDSRLALYDTASHGLPLTHGEALNRGLSACAELTRRAGLGELVDVVDGTATDLPLADASMDFAWMQAVSISVPDKSAMAHELRRVLRPGGRLAFFDSTAGPTGEPYFPLPWADDPQASFVVGADELKVRFGEAGLEPVVWNEQEAALGTISRQRFDPTVDPSRVGLDLLMPDFEVRMANVGRSIGEGRLRLLQTVLRAV